MISINTVRKLFMPQTASSDCGVACIAMLLNYAGQYNKANQLLNLSSADEDGLSLLKLKQLAISNDIMAKCVTMDLEILSDCETPCILHILNGRQELHFVVCFATKRSGDKPYIIADPATGVHVLDAAELEAIWKSKAALFVEELEFVALKRSDYPWFALIRINSLEKSLLISILFLNLCIAVLGISLSWMLQRGLGNPLNNRSLTVIISVLLLLFIMTLCRGVILFIKQKVLIKINISINEELLGILKMRILERAKSGKLTAPGYMRKALSDIQKIQTAVSTFIGIFLCEGSLVVIFICCLFYYQPLCGCIVIVFLITIAIIAVRASGEILFSNAQLRELAGYLENGLVNETLMSSASNTRSDKSSESDFLSAATSLASKVSELGLIYDWISTCCITSVFALCLYKISVLQLSYESLMVVVIISYFVTTLAARMCNSLSVVSEGAYLIRRYQS